MSAAATDSNSHTPHQPHHEHYSRTTLLVLATIAGVSVANIYTNQPLLAAFRASFPESAGLIGAVPAVTQLGYAIGMLLLAPLGDRFDRRLIILLQLAALGIALVAATAAPTLGVLIAASLALGIVATIAQQAVPFAAELAPPAQRGHAVGTVMSGLLIGILLARTVSGFVAEYFGWRAVYGASVVATIALAVLVVIAPAAQQADFHAALRQAAGLDVASGGRVAGAARGIDDRWRLVRRVQHLLVGADVVARGRAVSSRAASSRPVRYCRRSGRAGRAARRQVRRQARAASGHLAVR